MLFSCSSTLQYEIQTEATKGIKEVVGTPFSPLKNHRSERNLKNKQKKKI